MSQGQELPDRGGRGFGGEAETLLDGQRQVHALQTVQAEFLETHFGMKFVRRQRPPQPVCEHFGDDRAVFWVDLIRTNLPHFWCGHRWERMGPWTDEEVVGNVGRLLWTASVVPRLEPAVHLVTLQPRQLVAVELLNGDFQAAPRHEEHQVEQQPEQTDHRRPQQLGPFPRPGVGGPAAPHAARSYQHHRRLGDRPQDVRERPVRTEALDAVALHPACRPEDKVFSPPQTGDYLRQCLFSAPASLVAWMIEVRDQHGAQQLYQQAEDGAGKKAFVEHGPRPVPIVESRQDEYGFDVSGVVWQKEYGALQSADLVPPMHADPVAKRNNETRQPQQNNANALAHVARRQGEVEREPLTANHDVPGQTAETDRLAQQPEHAQEDQGDPQQD